MLILINSNEKIMLDALNLANKNGINWIDTDVQRHILMECQKKILVKFYHK